MSFCVLTLLSIIALDHGPLCDGRSAADETMATLRKIHGTSNVAVDDGFRTIAGVEATVKTLKKGNCGVIVEPGDVVFVDAHISDQKTKKKLFDTRDEGDDAHSFQLEGSEDEPEEGIGTTFKAWELGTIGMCQDEMRELLVPADEAFGSQGNPLWDVPKNTDLRIEFELRQVKYKYNYEWVSMDEMSEMDDDLPTMLHNQREARTEKDEEEEEELEKYGQREDEEGEL